MAALNLHAMRLGPGKHLKGLTLFNGIVKPEEVRLWFTLAVPFIDEFISYIKFDYFHELIISQEFSRVAARGYGDGLNGGMVIGLPPVLNFGSSELKAKIVPEVLSSKKYIW